MRPAH